MKVKTLHLNEEGLLRFLGSLEAKIMSLLWEKGRLTIKQAHEILNRADPLSLTTVLTVMVRLADKGLLHKESTGGGRNRLTFFTPVQTREQFITEQTKSVTDGLVEDFGSLMVSHLVDNLDKADPELIARLEKKLSELKQKP
ncbi:BlaI/MecI/CopY family transcriptional regulator [Cohnella rhizosphaerae]|uniref:BlaI/MecI/CopY family transcriptional regulator n=1 Tax=Cohnella rhizosphaerae TaxID=1457232 RepID=A0A9X4KW86_9BACL|nr:BlaI/MecI/CopY family transcriptional regulator [Cohnella rhizosphaerae]MDG0809137.1 BlaI/MecI/CopY family transcriptional regulator [Cohnella rhizosphaerae]